MSSRVIGKKDPRLSECFKRFDSTVKQFEKLDLVSRNAFDGERFLTDRDLSEKIKISRRTLQDYRTTGMIPYYLICGKVIYKESEIEKMLQDARKQTFNEMELL